MSSCKIKINHQTDWEHIHITSSHGFIHIKLCGYDDDEWPYSSEEAALKLPGLLC